MGLHKNSQRNAPTDVPRTEFTPGYGSPDSNKASRWRWQFGLLEFQGVLIFSAVLHFLLGEFRPRRLSEDWQGFSFAIAIVLALGAAYLSTRLATKRRIDSAWRRLILQAAFTFLIVPLLAAGVLVVFAFCLSRF